MIMADRDTCTRGQYDSHANTCVFQSSLFSLGAFHNSQSEGKVKVLWNRISISRYNSSRDLIWS